MGDARSTTTGTTDAAAPLLVDRRGYVGGARKSRPHPNP